MLERLLALEFVGIKLGLDNIRTLCAALGHPEHSFRAIHIAGTNGKGSVTAVVHEALLAAGIRSARYTSPHLSHLRERFVIGHDAVDEQTLDSVATEVLDRADQLVRQGELAALPTFFEATTAIGFELFRRAGVEAAVIEVGLGGRFDATNVLSPAVGAITSIGFDHQKYLGDTIAAIAFEKAGIIKEGMTVVTGPLPAEAAAVIERCARERGATLIPCLSDTSLQTAFDGGSAQITLTTPQATYGPVILGLRGAHQIANAAVAVRVLEAASLAGLRVGRDAIERGLSGARWPARLELIELPDTNQQILIDAAHNPDGAAALAAYLSRWYSRKVTLVIGLMSDKDSLGILNALLPVVADVITTAAPTPRALPAAELAERIRAIDPGRQVLVEPSPGAALDLALSLDHTVCVAGSIFLAGAIRDVLNERAILR